MPRKNAIQAWPIINAVSMGATITASPTNVEFLDNIGLHVVWSSSNAVGTITVEGSNTYNPNTGAGTWFALTFSPVLTQPASNNGDYGISINQFPWSWLRVVYTRVSGTGTLTVTLSAKEI
jgi:hypothetical protein